MTDAPLAPDPLSADAPASTETETEAGTRPTGARPWWRDAVVYQVYARSFADSDGSGVGDLPGIRSRLPYLRDLGVDALWITPFYPSPMADGGYDVADYRDVEPTLGTLADLDGIIADAHELGLRLVVDIVPNHTSSAHEWFRAALAASPGSPERARYLFRDGTGPQGEVPPNDWRSTFGGTAWTRVTEADGRPGQWYLHLFDSSQPDLDWTNPQVHEDFLRTLRFWLDRGVDGFRIDVAHGLAKAAGLPDAGLDQGQKIGEVEQLPTMPMWDQPAVHDIFREWMGVVGSYPGDRMTVGEVWVDDPVALARYVRPDELSQAFNFRWLFAPWTPQDFREVIESSLQETSQVGAAATWVLSNHDVRRHVTRYGSLARARAATLAMLALPGCAYLYQGEELGLPEVLDLPEEVLQDPTWERSGHTERGRDGCRVPIPWSGDGPPFGFGPDGSVPWLPQPADWAQLSVAAQTHVEGSTLELYRQALRLRRQLLAEGPETLAWLDAGSPDVLAFTRAGVGCLLNMGSTGAELPLGAEVLLSSGPLAAGGSVPADTAVWYRAGTP